MAADEMFPTAVSDEGTSQVGSGGPIAVLGAATGLGALAASSCCVLPLALGGLGAGAGVFTALEALAPLRFPLMASSALAVAVGWWLLYARRQQVPCGPEATCATSRRPLTVAVTLSAATVLVITAAAWGSFEPALLKFLRTV